MSKRRREDRNTSPVKSYRASMGIKPLLRTAKNIRSVTTKQVKDAIRSGRKSGRYILSNSQLFNLRFCARITEINQEEDHTDFILNDGTGVMNARIWPRNKTGFTHLTGATINAYYDIVGDLVIVSGDILLRADTVRKVTNHNTVTMHMLAVIHEQCTLGQLRNEDVEYWEKAEEDAKTYVATKLDKQFEKEAIIEFLATEQARESTSGPTAQDIFRHCQLETAQGWDILEDMLNKGIIYNTTSNFNFKIVSNN